MIQPYPGEWKIPAEGLVLYDYYDGKAMKLTDKYEISLKGLSDKLLHLCPVRHGWAVIGDVNKYLSPATVSSLVVTDTSLMFNIREAGDFYFWIDNGIPECNYGQCRVVDDNLWRVTLDDEAVGSDVVITKK